MLFTLNAQISSITFWPHSHIQSGLASSRVLSWLTFARLIQHVLQITSMSVSVRIHEICQTLCNGSFWCVRNRQAYNVAFRGLCSFTGWYLGLDRVAFTIWSINMNELFVRDFPGKKLVRLKPLLCLSQQKWFVKLTAGEYSEVGTLPGIRSGYTC